MEYLKMAVHLFAIISASEDTEDSIDPKSQSKIWFCKNCSKIKEDQGECCRDGTVGPCRSSDWNCSFFENNSYNCPANTKPCQKPKVEKVWAEDEDSSNAGYFTFCGACPQVGISDWDGWQCCSNNSVGTCHNPVTDICKNFIRNTVECELGYDKCTDRPTFSPTMLPSVAPTTNPTSRSTNSIDSTLLPIISANPTWLPTANPTLLPTANPTLLPTDSTEETYQEAGSPDLPLKKD